MLRFLKYRFIDVPDPTHEDFERALRSSIVAIITVVIFMNSSLTLNTGLYLVVGGFLHSLTGFGETRRARLLMMLSMGLFACASVFFVTLISLSKIAFFVYIFVVTWLFFQLQRYGLNVMFPVVCMLILNLVAGASPGGLIIAWERLLGMMIGFAVSFVATCFLWPYRPKVALKRLDAVIKKRIQYYLRWVLGDFLCGNAKSERVMLAKENGFDSLMSMRKILLNYPDPHFLELVEHRSSLFGQVMMLNRFLSEPKIFGSFTSILPEIVLLRDALVILCKENPDTLHEAYEQVVKIAYELQVKHANNEDILCLCYLLNRTAALVKQGGRVV